MKKGVKLGAQNLLLLNLIKLFFMSTIIICLICTALMFGVEYFGRRHMRLFKLKAESQGGENVVSAVDQVYYGGKESDKSEAERLRTRKIKYVLWVLIVFFGAASIVFVAFKDQWLGEWSTSSHPQQTEFSETAQQKSEFFDLRLYWDYEYVLRYYEEKKVLAKEEAEAEYAKYQQAMAHARSRTDKFIYTEKLTQAKEKLISTQEALDEFDSFAIAINNLKIIHWSFFALFTSGFLMAFYILYRKEENAWTFRVIIILYMGVIAGIFFMCEAFIKDYFSFMDLAVLLLMIIAYLLIKKCDKYIKLK